MAKLNKSQFAFRKNDTIGAEGAELDRSYLEDCYFDRGDLNVIRDCLNPACIIVGRTGAGKTAILFKLKEEEEHVIEIKPESLSLQYLSNSTVLPQLEAIGVNLGLFYKLLWRHILAVELIKAKYGLRTESESRTFLQRIWEYFSRDREKERAVQYLRDWGEDFWKDTEYRVKEVTERLEKNVKDSLGAKWPSVLDFSASSEDKRSVEIKGEVVKNLQSVVDSIQVRELTKVIRMLGDDVFNNTQQRFYVLIDSLDDSWVDDDFRYRLIKSLVETVNEVNQNMKGVKIVVAIRRDLLDLVIHETRDQGFQEEKYEPLYLSLNWTSIELFGMLDKRLNKLVRRQYTGQPVSWSDLMPKAVAKQVTTTYLIERTMYRPRDLIVFFNLCIQQAVGRPDITAQMILHAELEYSQRRLRSLYDEWHAEFPELEDCVKLLKRLPARFPLDGLTDNAIGETCLTLAAEARHAGSITRWALLVADQKVTPERVSPAWRVLFTAPA